MEPNTNMTTIPGVLCGCTNCGDASALPDMRRCRNTVSKVQTCDVQNCVVCRFMQNNSPANESVAATEQPLPAHCGFCSEHCLSQIRIAAVVGSRPIPRIRRAAVAGSRLKRKRETVFQRFSFHNSSASPEEGNAVHNRCPIRCVLCGQQCPFKLGHRDFDHECPNPDCPPDLQPPPPPPSLIFRGRIRQ
jgi:hypothetical protein